MNGKAKVSNFIKLFLMSFLESSGAKFDIAIGKVFILQLKRESEVENEKRKKGDEREEFAEGAKYPW